MSDGGSIRDECAHVFSALPEWGPDQLMVCEKNCGMRATMQDPSRLTALESGIKALVDTLATHAASADHDRKAAFSVTDQAYWEGRRDGAQDALTDTRALLNATDKGTTE